MGRAGIRKRRRPGQGPDGPRSEPIPPVSGIDPPPDTFRRRAVKAGRRLLAGAAFVLAAYVAYAFVAAPLLDRREQEAAAEVEEAPVEVLADPPPRPESAPQRIPPWAWELHEWHSAPQSERGPRPAQAPTRVPEWYWEWRAWRLEVAPPAS